jgi:uncharacterized protein YndB with AHSA1/START domain
METVTSNRSAKVTLPTDEQILITREFAAPPHLVYRAYTTPELVERWWHAKRGEIKSIEIDLRVGGSWRYVMVACNAGIEVAFHGEYSEVVPDERIAGTEIYEGAPDHPALTTTTFAPIGADSTLLTILVEHDSQFARDMHIQSGMEDGLQDALDLAEAVAVSLGE